MTDKIKGRFKMKRPFFIAVLFVKLFYDKFA